MDFLLLLYQSFFIDDVALHEVVFESLGGPLAKLRALCRFDPVAN